MSKKVIIFIEGGRNPTLVPGDRDKTRENELINIGFRYSVAQFLSDALSSNGLPTVTIEPCGGWREAAKRFEKAFLANKNPNEEHLLLIDSEAPFQAGGDPKRQLNKRLKKKWSRSRNLHSSISSAQIFLMVQCTETWFISNPHRVGKYFRDTKGGYNTPQLCQAIENELAKAKPINKKLNRFTRIGPRRATRRSNLKKAQTTLVEEISPKTIMADILNANGISYSKDDGFSIWPYLDAAIVRRECPSCDRFIRALEAILYPQGPQSATIPSSHAVCS